MLAAFMLAGSVATIGASPLMSPSEDGWTLVAEKGDVKAYAQIANCGNDGPLVYLIKVVNGSRSVAVDVNYVLSVNNHPALGTYRGALKLGPRASEAGGCDTASDVVLKAETFGDNPVLENLELKVLTVNNLSDEK